MKHPLVLKSLALVAVFLALLLALSRIEGLVDERRARQQQAQQSVEQSQAGRQTLLGPVLHRSCVEEWERPVGQGANSSLLAEKREFRLTAVPARLEVQASASLQPRYRGLFKVNSFGGKAVLKAQWDSLATLVPERKHADSRMNCGAPILMVTSSDPRGFLAAQVQVQGQPLKTEAGTFHGSYPRGFHAVLPASLPLDQPMAAQLELELIGTAELSLAPVAGDTRVQLDSDWPHPSFAGRFLPANRDVKPEGFSATWRVSSLATTAPADFVRGARLCSASAWSLPDSGYAAQDHVSTAASGDDGGCIETFGVSFIDPVNPYVLGDRATKYGLLFIGLTFVAVAMVEVLKRRRVHPVQYLLVGCALVTFFLLLVSLSEHLPFGLAYAGASTGCALLLAYYGGHILGGWLAGLAFGTGVGLLYGALYTLLQMEQTALVLGSLLLFAVLAAVMVVTRKLDWYGLSAQLGSAPATPAGRAST
ncbi:cell envelope integrity protein CreD [Aquabacterium sp. A7-Y]|uniref:cell envelope integrity protein CreD n=1 Tax=Aquabacterium sp. A7-Y TaxID=1349605 RepID=UPI00223DF50B|nr:cell envelope integrity protein CreD [Aquabacterium sp. A7-Y]MCW7538353.1 cell envelope integrity protein CreD [Aquabacterium sp. A7-Y]